MRKLASIQRITNIEPIKGADRIEQAKVLGWHLVVPKGEFTENELVVYFEIDSVFPAWLKERTGLTDSRLKTRRFKGVYSQGFCFPIKKLSDKLPVELREGDDVTAALDIQKYEADPYNGKKWWRQPKKGPQGIWATCKLTKWLWKKLHKPAMTSFPDHLVPRTDETRVQILQDILTEYKGVKCNYTEKLDGSSITFYPEPKKFLGITYGYKLRVCSRNCMINDKTHFMYQAAEKEKRWLKAGYIYQGELLGPNVQGNKYGLDEYRIFIYQIYSLKKKRYLTPIEMRWWQYSTGLDFVPDLGEFTLTDDIDALVEMAKGDSVLSVRGKNTKREGIVIRPLAYIDGLDKSKFPGGRLSFKAINPEFLVKYKL